MHWQRLRVRRGHVLGMSAVVAAAAVTACGSSSGGSATSSASGGSATSSASSTTSSSKHVQLGMQIGLSNQQFAQDMFVGGRDSAAKSNASLLTAAPTNIDPSASIGQVDSMLAQSPAGMVIWDVPSTLWVSTLEKTSKATNGDVIAIDTPPVPSTHVLFVGNDNVAFGRTLVSTTVKQAKIPTSTTGTVLVGSCVPSDELLQARVKGMTQELATTLPHAHVVSFNSQLDPTQTFAAWQNEVQSNSNIVATFGTCAQDGPAMVKAVGKAAKPFAIGDSETSPQNNIALKDGKIAAIVAGNYYPMGYLAVQLSAEAARGQKLPTGWLDTGFGVFTKADATTLITRDSSTAGLRSFYTKYLASYESGLQSHVKPLSEVDR